MNAPASSGRSKAAPAGLAIALAGLLGVSEGREHLPYYDQAGVLTVCRGITGPEVVKGHWYGWGECDALEQKFLNRMLATMGPCVGAGLNIGEWKAWGHFTYNIGTRAFCNSTASKLLRAGAYPQACAQMKRWVFLTKPRIGAVDCRVAANKCGGLPKRRELEYGMCMAAQDDGSTLQ